MITSIIIETTISSILPLKRIWQFYLSLDWASAPPASGTISPVLNFNFAIPQPTFSVNSAPCVISAIPEGIDDSYLTALQELVESLRLKQYAPPLEGAIAYFWFCSHTF